MCTFFNLCLSFPHFVTFLIFFQKIHMILSYQPFMLERKQIEFWIRRNIPNNFLWTDFSISVCFLIIVLFFFLVSSSIIPGNSNFHMHQVEYRKNNEIWRSAIIKLLGLLQRIQNSLCFCSSMNSCFQSSLLKTCNHATNIFFTSVWGVSTWARLITF